MSLPTDDQARKDIPIFSGVLMYFPDALAEVAKLSRIGNEQHNPGEPLHWARGKSMNQLDTLVRHLMEVGTLDTDGVRHSAKVAWRALANLQLELEGAAATPSRTVIPASPFTIRTKSGNEYIISRVEGYDLYEMVGVRTGETSRREGRLVSQWLRDGLWEVVD